MRYKQFKFLQKCGNTKKSRSSTGWFFPTILFYILCMANVQGQDLEQRLGSLEKELESLKLLRATKKHESAGGLGPAASEIYHANSGLSIGSYGEAKYTHYDSDYASDTADLHRFILYLGYRFNDWLLLNTEIEIEHVNEVFAEFAYLDFLFDPAISLGLGLQLIPVGIFNYQHEPTTFYSVNRPQTEKNIIPSTWRELGLMLHGEVADKIFAYRIGIFSGGNAEKFTEEKWIRDGRQKGSKAVSNHLAGAVQFTSQPIPSLHLGLSYYLGDNGQGKILPYDADVQRQMELAAGNKNRFLEAKIRTHLAEAHLHYEWGPLYLRSLYARGWMSDEDARAVNRKTNKNIGKTAEGVYLETGFDLLRFFSVKEKKLYFFVRHEYLNTQKETVTCQVGVDCAASDYELMNASNSIDYTGNRAIGVIDNEKYDTADLKGLPNPANDRRIWVYGAAFFPDPKVVLKLDLENWSSESTEEERTNPKNNKINRINFSVGWVF